MRGLFILAFILIAMVLLVVFGEQEKLMGLAPERFAQLVMALAIAIPALGYVVSRYRGQWSKALEAIAIWLAIAVALVGGYTYRLELEQVANRIASSIVPGWTVATPGGAVEVVRTASGSFVLKALVNGTSLNMVFDTGASMVVLTPQAAIAAGIDPKTLIYSAVVRTANGKTRAAPVTLEAVRVGPITERRVQAFVAQEGALFENLLGMSFLERLGSYEVRGDRLIMRAQAR